MKVVYNRCPPGPHTKGATFFNETKHRFGTRNNPRCSFCLEFSSYPARYLVGGHQANRLKVFASQDGRKCRRSPETGGRRYGAGIPGPKAGWRISGRAGRLALPRHPLKGTDGQGSGRAQDALAGISGWRRPTDSRWGGAPEQKSGGPWGSRWPPRIWPECRQRQPP